MRNYQGEARLTQELERFEYLQSIRDLRKEILELQAQSQDREEVKAGDPAWRYTTKENELQEMVTCYSSRLDSEKECIETNYSIAFEKLEKKHALERERITERFEADLQRLREKYDTDMNFLKKKHDKEVFDKQLSQKAALENKEAEYHSYITRKQSELEAVRKKKQALLDNQPKKLVDVRNARLIQEKTALYHNKIAYFNSTCPPAERIDVKSMPTFALVRECSSRASTPPPATPVATPPAPAPAPVLVKPAFSAEQLQQAFPLLKTKYDLTKLDKEGLRDLYSSYQAWVKQNPGQNMPDPFIQL